MGEAGAEAAALFALLVADFAGSFSHRGQMLANDLPDASERVTSMLRAGDMSPDAALLRPLARRLVALIRSEALAQGVEIARDNVTLDQGRGYGTGGASNEWDDVEDELRKAQSADSFGHCTRRRDRRYANHEPLTGGLCASCIAWGKDSHRFEKGSPDAD